MKGDIQRKLLYIVQSGQPIVNGYREIGGRYRKVANQLEGGASLADAVQKARLMPMEQVLTLVGEQAGKLEDAYETLAKMMDMQEAYVRRLMFAVIRSVVLAGVGVAGSYGLMRWLKLEIPVWWQVWVVVAGMVLGLLGAVLSMLSPGWRTWVRLLSTRFMLIAGVSFDETFRYLKMAGLNPGKGDAYWKLLRLSGEEADLVSTAEGAGTTENAIQHLEKKAKDNLERWKNRLSTFMYYVGVVVALATVLAGVLAFALAGFGSLNAN